MNDAKRKFEYEFKEEPTNQISFDYSPNADEQLDVLIENDVPIIYLNRSALITLAKLFVKMALGAYRQGFHVHLRKDFNEDEPDRLIVMLRHVESADQNASGPIP